jgi:hypothetical protein
MTKDGKTLKENQQAFEFYHSSKKRQLYQIFKTDRQWIFLIKTLIIHKVT